MVVENDKEDDYWHDALLEEFTKETDRASVILVSALFDQALESLLKSYLIPSTSSEHDELFDIPNASLANFSNKITTCFRLGLISHKFCRDLNIIRKIRNDFAHDIHNCNFNNIRVKSRIEELKNSSGIIKRNPIKRKTFQDGVRGDFLMICSWMIFSLQMKVKRIKSVEMPKIEFGYNESLDEKKVLEEETKQAQKNISKPQ